MLRTTATLVASFFVCGCNSTNGTSSHQTSVPEPQSDTLAVPPQAPALSATASEQSPCVISQGLRFGIDAGHVRPTGTGIEIGYEGASHDNFGAADTAISVSLLFRRGTEQRRHLLPIGDRSSHALFGHCYRLVEAVPEAVVLDVSVLPSQSGKPAGVVAAPSSAAAPKPSVGVVGAGAAPPPGAARCTVADDNGPLPGGRKTTRGCGSSEICICEARAGYSCAGRCAPAQPASTITPGRRATGRDGRQYPSDSD